MTRGQQAILLIMLLLLLGVTILLVVTLIGDRATSEVPTLAALPTAAAAATQLNVPPTWTAGPSRTPPATNTPRGTHTATAPPTITPTFAPTYTPRPTPVVTATASASPGPLGLENPGFEGIRPNFVPGWAYWAEDNFTPGGPYNPDTSFETPLIKQADDPVRFITGPTLQIDAVQHLKYRVHVFQTVVVTPTATVRFQVKAGAYSGSGVIKVGAGIDPAGGSDCQSARWSEILALNQEGGVRSLTAPQATVGEGGKVTVCLYAEPIYAAVSNAAFFDDAELLVNP